MTGIRRDPEHAVNIVEPGLACDLAKLHDLAEQVGWIADALTLSDGGGRAEWVGRVAHAPEDSHNREPNGSAQSSSDRSRSRSAFRSSQVQSYVSGHGPFGGSPPVPCGRMQKCRRSPVSTSATRSISSMRRVAAR